MSVGYFAAGTCYASLDDAASAWASQFPNQQGSDIYSLTSKTVNVGAGSVDYIISNSIGKTFAGTVYPSVCDYQSNFNMPVQDMIGALGIVLCFAAGAIMGSLT